MSIHRGEIWQSKHAADRVIEIVDVFGPMVTITNGSGRERVLTKSELFESYVNVDGSIPELVQPTPQGDRAHAGISAPLAEIARARGSKSITKVEMPVGPELAAELLGNNPSNRGIRREHVDGLARDMARGRWRKSHSGIAIGPTGALGDGQHRLLAICKSGVKLVLDISQYHDAVEFHDARTVWDTGWKRTKGSALELAGLVPSGQGRFIAPIIEAMAWVDARLPRRPTSEDVVAIFTERRASIEAVYQLNPREFLSATRAAFALAHGKCPEAIGTCIELVCSKANLEEGSAALAIVRALPQLRDRCRGRERPKCVTAMLSLLHKHVKGRPGVDRLRHNQEAIDFFLGKNFRGQREAS